MSFIRLNTNDNTVSEITEKRYTELYPGGLLNNGVIELEVIHTPAPTFNHLTEKLINDGYSRVDDNWARYWRVEPLSDSEKIAMIDQLADQAEQQIMELAKEEIAVAKVETIRAELATVTDNVALQSPEKYKPYKVGIPMIGGSRFFYPVDGKLYRVNNGQDHTTALHWPPPFAVSLYTPVTPEGVIAPWVQPTHAETAYRLGVKVSHNNKEWENLIDYNVHAPGVSGWKNLSVPPVVIPLWSSFASHQFQTMPIGTPVMDNGTIYYLINPGQGFRQPSGTSGHFGWSTIKP